MNYKLMLRLAVSKVLRNPKSSKSAKTAAGLALTQRTSSTMLRNKIKRKPDISAAGIALSQRRRYSDNG